MPGKHLSSENPKERRELAPLIAVALILLGLTLGSFLAPDQAFSANENRYLQQAPKLTWQTLMAGTFSTEAEKYLSDQMLLRESWMEGKSLLQRATGKKDIGGVYLGAEGYYFARLPEDDFDRSRFEKNVGFVSRFFATNENKSCRILLVPTPDTVLSDKLPKNAVTFDRAACDTLLADTFAERAVLPYAALVKAAETEQVYYRTDHHWTSQGAETAYRQWAASMGYTPRQFTLTEVSDSFRGTMYSKVLLPDSAYDSIYLDRSVTIRSMDCDGTEYPSLYVDAALQQKDQYEVFMGGNYAKAVIDTGADTGKSLLLIKDSFANCFIPFLAGEYDTITVLDLRFFRGSVQELADASDDILVLYEMTNFAGDANLFKLQK